MGGGYRREEEAYPRFDAKPRGPELRHIYNDRLSQFLDGGEYRDVNLHSMLYHDRVDGEEFLGLEVYSPPELSRPLFEHAVTNTFRPAKKGDTFGPSWSTHWFKITIKKIPAQWRDYERVQLEFDLPEALIYDNEGSPLQGLTGGSGGDRRVEFILKPEIRKSERPVVLWIETSMNGMFGVGGEGTIQPPDQNRYFTLASCDLVAPNMIAWRLMWDYIVIRDISREMPQDGYESHEALKAANRIMNTFQSGNEKSLIACRKIADSILGTKRDTHDVYGSKAVRPPVTAVGHCHIDTAWLWPFAETKRKIARSWSTQLDLMTRYPEHIFTCSQAQQFKWLKQDYPKLFAKILHQVQKGQFEPIGGTWTEMDTNLPSGESLVRQFLLGQRFFEKNFGKRCSVFWLPDTFGYSSQLPQLVRLAGMNSFFTQKLSWNNINDFPHTSFNWNGLDGSQVLTHMTPNETYTAQADLIDVKRCMSQHKNLSDTRSSLLVFGNGDGGGGPLATMLEKLRRCRGASENNAPSLPAVKMSSVTEFFHELLTDSNEGKDLRTWSGELYFEFHRGTYTSQALTKFFNRKCENLLHDVEYFCSLASLYIQDYRYPKSTINELWEDVALCQFHDVLPGSCIGMVYEDEHRIHRNVLKVGKALLNKALDGLDIRDNLRTQDSQPIALNTMGWARKALVRHNETILTISTQHGIAATTVRRHEGDAVIDDLGHGQYILSNSNVAVHIENGCILSFYDKQVHRELIPVGQVANQYLIYEDQPLSWQAWDVEIFHLDKEPTALSGGRSSVISTDNNRVSIAVEYKISEKSWIRSVISLDSSHVNSQDCCKQLDIVCEAEWHENKKFLKVAFPTTLHADHATYETQFGIIKRPTHFNTTWDEAKFEVCCHKFADLSEFNYGLSILNDCKYGFATHGNIMRLSLLRAPKAPDDRADMGRHHFKYAMLAHSQSLPQSRVVQKAFEFNNPLVLSRQATMRSLDHFSLQGDDNVILNTIKMAEDSNGIVLRYYETLGGRGRVHLTIPTEILPKVKKAFKVNILEDIEEEMKIIDGKVLCQLRPFEVQSCLFKL